MGAKKLTKSAKLQLAHRICEEVEKMDRLYQEKGHLMTRDEFNEQVRNRRTLNKMRAECLGWKVIIGGKVADK